MVLRTQTTIGALLILASALRMAAAEPVTFQVRHRHLHSGIEGVLRVTADGIAFEETGKHADHSRNWRFEDIEQLTLAPESLRILTYENAKWRLRGDREYEFDRLPPDLSAQLYPLFSRRLDQRFIAALPDPEVKALWQAPAKLLHWRNGPQGNIVVASDRVVFQSDSPGQSRSWRIKDIDSISSSGPFDLTITTFERAGGTYAAHKDFHFALKRPLADADYNALWAKVNQAQGLKILNYPEGERP